MLQPYLCIRADRGVVCCPNHGIATAHPRSPLDLLLSVLVWCVRRQSPAAPGGMDASNPMFAHRVIEKKVFVARTPPPKNPLEVSARWQPLSSLCSACVRIKTASFVYIVHQTCPCQVFAACLATDVSLLDLYLWCVCEPTAPSLLYSLLSSILARAGRGCGLCEPAGDPNVPTHCGAWRHR